MTPQDAITIARDTINDTETTPRNSDAELLRYFNDGLREISVLNPAIYTVIGDLTCVPGACEQAVTFLDAQALIRVVGIHNGNAVTPFDIDVMDAFRPGWRTDTAGPAQQWSKHPGNPLRFFIYPKAPATEQILDAMYVRNPTIHLIGDAITEIPSGFMPALAQYIVSRAESKDDEHVLSERALAAYQAFVAIVKGG